MESLSVQYENKLKKLLTKFLEPGYKLGNDIYLNILLSHLSGKNPQVRQEDVIRLPIFTEWLEQAVGSWEVSAAPSSSIATFALNLASIISVSEENFGRLNSRNVYLRLWKVLRNGESPPSVKLGYLKMLSSFMTHTSGLEWLAATEGWGEALSYCLANQTIYITREGYNFMSELLRKYAEVNGVFCDMVVGKIVANLDAGGVFVDDEGIKKVLPALRLVSHVLEKFLMTGVDRRVAGIFLEKHKLESTLWELLIVANDPEHIFVLSKILFVAMFLDIDISKVANKETSTPEFKKFGHRFVNIFNILVQKENALNILKICYLGHNYWPKINEHLPPSEKKEPILFENQIIVFQIMPLLFIAFSHAHDFRDDELTDMFVNKIFKISCQQTIRLAYSFRDVIELMQQSNAFDLAQKSIFYIMKVRHHFHRDRAVIVFQALMYAMKSLAKLFITKHHTIIDLQPHQIGFLSAMFDGLGMLIKDFKITWRESVESICLTSLTIDFLNCLNLPTKLTVQGLQLMHLTIANFMPPNLALLVNEVTDSSVQSVTPMLYKRLHDMEWEVRDSALEILQTIAEISYLKFPAFQKLVLDDRLCQLSVTLSTEDQESFVRASAVKSLTAMTKVSIYWTKCLVHECLPEKMMSVLQNETEALVRCEAAKLVCELYDQQLIPQHLIYPMYTTMASAATCDLHWEVKVNSLDFWEKVINSEMSNQGMIDGVFPSVTFSKENKKIVTLNEREIQNRLDKVLVKLSESGCLGVLLSTIQDSCDLQVARKGVEITKKLSEQLKKYNMLTKTVDCMEDYRDSNEKIAVSKSIIENDESSLSNTVIDSIVNSTDITLLATVFKNQVNTNHLNVGAKELMVVKPEFFKCYLAQDLDGLIVDRDNWLESVDDLNSLLDDILKSYEDTDINSMDCY